MDKIVIGAYQRIIDGPSCVGVFDCDSTVIASKVSLTGEIFTTGEWLSDVALALWRRTWNPNIVWEVDAIAQKTMSTPGAVFEDSLKARFEILKKYGLEKQDVQLGAEEAIFSPWFAEFIALKDWLKVEQNIAYDTYFFLSGGFQEMLTCCLEKVITKLKLQDILFANIFAYEQNRVIWFDTKKSRMWQENAKKTMVEKLRQEWKIVSQSIVSWVWDGSNDISMSDAGYFVAYSWVMRREKVVALAQGVEAFNFFEIAVFHTSPEEKTLIFNSWEPQHIETLKKWIVSLRQRVPDLDFPFLS